jgi:CHRD domain
VAQGKVISRQPRTSPHRLRTGHKEEFMRQVIAFPVGAAAIAALLAFAPAAYAETVKFKADLTGASEVPPNTTTGKGTVTATYDTATKQLSWKGDYSGLSGPATAAHFHGPAPAGKNAGVALAIKPATSPFEGSATLTDAQATDLMAGDWYVNVHTDANKGGEVRGQLTKM